jgi:DNA-directed RNA polymerase specialized sigma24 family protein
MQQAQRSRDRSDDQQIALQLERIIHRVKQSMNYRGSYSTRDILGSLVARWVRSGEWDRLKQVPPEQRHLGESVRRFILDRFDQLRRRGTREDLDTNSFVLPDEPALTELVELAELRVWISARVTDLVAALVDARVRIPPTRPVEIGRVLQLHLSGKSQRQIANELGISLGLVNKRLGEGTQYLVLLQGIECGLG